MLKSRLLRLETFLSQRSEFPKFVGARTHLKSLVFLAVTFCLFGLIYAYGLNVGMDRRFAGPMDTRAQQIAAALSDSAYNLNLKYALHTRIFNALNKGGLSDLPENYQPHGLKSPDYISNAAWWNDLLDKATRLNDVRGTPRVSDRTLTFIQMEDLGIVDFFKLSFRLFGHTVQGFFKTYFLLLGLGVACLVAAFWSRPGILAGANLLLLGLLFSVCRLDDTDSVANGRFFATLAIFPTFHLLLLVWAPPKPTAAAVTASVVQFLLLAFVVTMRGSAGWGVLALVGSAIFVVAWKASSVWSSQPVKALVKKAVVWPVVVIAVGLVAFDGYQKSKIHPGYYALDETMPKHLVWHSLAYGLSFFPDIDQHVPGLDGVRGDGLPTYFGNAYLKKIMGFTPPSLSSYYGSYFFPNLGRAHTYERVVRQAYIDFIFEHPVKFLKFTLIIKPRMLLALLKDMLVQVAAKSAKYLVWSTVLVAAALLLVRPSAADKADLTFAALAIAGLAAATSLAPILAYPAYLGETFAVWVAMVAAFLSAAIWNWRSILARFRY